MQQVLTQNNGIVTIQIFNVLADGTARTAGNGKIQPCHIRLGMFGSNDFDRITGFQLGTQRHHDVIDTRGNGFMADVGMHGIGKVNRRCTLRQGKDIAFRGNDIDFVGEQIDFDMLQKLDGI